MNQHQQNAQLPYREPYGPYDRPPIYDPYPEDYQRPEYEHPDLQQVYGSIIKELTDTEQQLEKYELRLRGKKKLASGDIVTDPDREPYIKDDNAAREFAELVKSCVNRHVDFSYYPEEYGYRIIKGYAADISKWLMFQGDIVPLKYRFKISKEALSLISASCHKAMNGRMLVWTKGTFKEGMNITNSQDHKKSIWDYVIPFRNKRY